MNDFGSLQVKCQQVNREFAENFMNEFVECFAHR